MNARTSPSASDAAAAPLRASRAGVAALAVQNPRVTGFIRYRARQAGVPASPELIEWTPLDEVSPYLVCAVVRAEDPVFFQHRGIGWARLREALREAWKERRGVRGVSTLTQQLARTLYLHPERSIRRKVREAILARRLEGALSKARILELYLNVVEWGEGVWGIGAAARAHFGRTAAELDAFQAVVLASMLPAPRRPLAGWNAERALAVQKTLAPDLYGCGLLSRDGERDVRKRIVYLERAIAAGVPAAEILPRVPPLPEQPRVPAMKLENLLADECGLERWRRFILFVRRRVGEQRPLDLPLWWTGDPPPEPAAVRLDAALPAASG